MRDKERVRRLAVVLTLCLLPTRGAAQTAASFPGKPRRAAPIRVEGERLQPVTFGRLVLRSADDPEIRVSSDELRVTFVEEMRRYGYPALGAESLVFGQDRNEEARFELGGTVSELACSRDWAPAFRCRTAITWELLDRAQKRVVYQVLTRGKARGATGAEVARAVLLDAFHSLLSRPRFAQVLRKTEEPADAAVVTPLRYRRCTSPGFKMPAEAEKALEGVVVVESGPAFGSGTVISADGFVLTAAHVVANGGPLLVHPRQGGPVKAHVVRSSRRYDVALLAPDGALGERCLPLRGTPVQVGEELYAVGSPASRDLSFTLTRGIVSGSRNLDGVPLVQTDASINPGNSGGPMLDTNARVVGVVSWKLAGKAIEGIAFGVPATAALEALGLVGADESDPGLRQARAAAAPPVKPIVDAADPSQPLPTPVDSGPYQSPSTPSPAARPLLIGGIVTAAVGAGLVFGTWSVYEGRKEYGLKQNEFSTLRTTNAAGWAAVGLGGAAIIVSVSLPRRSPPKSAGAGHVEVGVGQSGLIMGGRY